MQDVEESISRSSLYDFFDDSIYSKNIKYISPSNYKTAEETPGKLVKENEFDSGATLKVEQVAGTSQSTTQRKDVTSPSDSEKILLDHVLENENSSLRSKTSEENAEKIDTSRTIKSDTAFSSGFYVDYPDIHGAGDSQTYVLVPNNDESLHIDIIVETGESDYGDRTTTETDVLRSADDNADAILSDNDDKPKSSTRDEETDTDSDSEYERDNGVVPRDFDYVYETDSEESEDSDAESGNGQCYKNDQASDTFTKNSEHHINGAYKMTDSDNTDLDTDSTASNYGSEFDEVNPTNEDNGLAKSVDDHLRLDCTYINTGSIYDQYDPCCEEENESSSEDNAETARQSEKLDRIDEPRNGDRGTDAISGTRETFTPFQAPVNDDDPCEGNRPESNNDVNNEFSAFHTRLNKTDGEGIMNVPLSRSFIVRNKDTCISEGAQTIGELIMALQRRRVIEMAQGEYQIEERRPEACEGEADGVTDNGQRSQNYVQNLEKTSGDMSSSENGSPVGNPRRDQSLVRTTNCDDGYLSNIPEIQSSEPLKTNSNTALKSDHGQTGATVETKKISGKTTRLGVNRITLDSKAVNKNAHGMQSLKSVPTNTKTHSAVQSRVPDQYAQRNLRKGSKPVLPAISKGTSKSAGQTVPTKVDSKSKLETQCHRDQTKNTANQRKPVLGDITVRNSPCMLNEPHRAAFPLIPVQLRSNACFRNGQLEVQVTCDDRMYPSADPMNVKVTFVHKHVQLTKSTKPSAYKAKIGKKSDRLLNSLSSLNRNIIHQRAQWPPFDTHLDPEASARHKKMFGSL